MPAIRASQPAVAMKYHLGARTFSWEPGFRDRIHSRSKSVRGPSKIRTGNESTSGAAPIEAKAPQTAKATAVEVSNSRRMNLQSMPES